MVGEMMDGIFRDQEDVLKDLRKAHRLSHFTDITFKMSDNVEISTNKFMLACRSPFFATMLFGGLKDGLKDKLELKCCDSEVMGKVLDFIWEGEVPFEEQDIQTLLEILETSRMMCLDSLMKGVEDYFKSLIESKKIDFEDCLVALDFVISNRLDNLAEDLLNYTDQNLESVRIIPSFKALSAGTMMAMLKLEGRKSKEIDIFKAYATWVKDKDDISTEMKTQMINQFDLKEFTQTEILKIVRKTNFFKDQDIYDVLEEKLNEMEEISSRQIKRMESQNMQLFTSKEALGGKEQQLWTLKNKLSTTEQQLHSSMSLLNSKKSQVESKDKQLNKLAIEVTKLKQHAKNVPSPGDINLCLAENGGKLFENGGYHGTQFDSEQEDVLDYIGNSYDIVYGFKASEFVNKVEFTLLHDSPDPYLLESSNDGMNWTQVVDFTKSWFYCRGKQTVYFEKKRMKYLCFKLERKIGYYEYPSWMRVEDGDVVAMLDTTTGERRNKGQN